MTETGRGDLKRHHPVYTPSVVIADVVLVIATRNNIRSDVQFILNVKRIAIFFFSLGVFCTRIESNSKILYISSYDPKALANLWKMFVSGQLLKGLSEILVREEYKQQFLNDWLIIINEDQFNSAVSKLERKESCQQQYWLMLQNLSREIERRNINIDRLKFALFDFVLIRGNLDEATTAFDLFMQLDNAGHINPNKVDLLIALFKLLWLDAFNDTFLKSKFQIANINPKNIFSEFRISLVNLSNNLQRDEIKKIGDMYAVPQGKCQNQWKMLQYLQDKGILSEGNLMDFMEKTGLNKDFLEWHPAKLLPIATENVKVPLMRKHSEVESSDTAEPCSKLPKPEDDPQSDEVAKMLNGLSIHLTKIGNA